MLWLIPGGSKLLPAGGFFEPPSPAEPGGRGEVNIEWPRLLTAC
jgi:hypothetical protein